MSPDIKKGTKKRMFHRVTDLIFTQGYSSHLDQRRHHYHRLKLQQRRRQR